MTATPSRDALGGLMSAGEQAAFHGRPADGLDPLRRVCEVGLPDDVGHARWLLGVCLTALGRFDEALRAVDAEPLMARAQVVDADPWAAHRLSLAGSAHRQQQRYATALACDERGLSTASPSAEGRADCRVGRSADLVGMGRADDAELEWRAAARAAAAAGGWRPTVRLAWVRAEIDLLTDRPADAVVALEPALRLATGAQAPRHVAKTMLFLGVAERGRARSSIERSRADQRIGAAAELARTLGAQPLERAARDLLAGTLWA